MPVDEAAWWTALCACAFFSGGERRYPSAGTVTATAPIAHLVSPDSLGVDELNLLVALRDAWIVDRLATLNAGLNMVEVMTFREVDETSNFPELQMARVQLQ